MENGLKNVKVRPMRVSAGDRIRTWVEYSGNLKNGFFDNAIINRDNEIVDWNPDPKTFDPHKYSGILHSNVIIKSDWFYFIPEWILPGVCTISVRVYDDIDGTVKTRKLIDKKDIEIQVKPSQSDIIKFLFLTYQNLFKREPDQNGLKTWYTALQIQGFTKATIVENGFLNSPEYKLRYFYTYMNLGDEIDQKLYDNWYNEIIRYGISDKKPYNLISKDISFKSKNITNNEYYEQILKQFKVVDGVSKRLINRICKDKSNKIDITLDIINNLRIKKLIIYNTIFPRTTDEKEDQRNLIDYIDNLITFDSLWEKHYKI